jgi:hypothetical protein
MLNTSDVSRVQQKDVVSALLGDVLGMPWGLGGS